MVRLLNRTNHVVWVAMPYIEALAFMASMAAGVVIAMELAAK